MKQPNFSRIQGVISTLGLTNTFSNPGLKLTVFVPTNNVRAPRRRAPPPCCTRARAERGPADARRCTPLRPSAPGGPLGLRSPSSLKDDATVSTGPQAFAAAEARTGISMNVLAQQKSLMQQVVYYHIVKEVGDRKIEQLEDVLRVLSHT